MYEKILQRNVTVEVKMRRRTYYKFWNRKVKEMVNESKRRVDDEFGRKLRISCFGKKLRERGMGGRV